MILGIGCSSNKLEQLKLLGKFYQKMELNFPSEKNHLKQKIRELTKKIYEALVRRVAKTNRLR